MTPQGRIKSTTCRAYGYARVSSDEQARSGLSIEAQRTAIDQAAERQGLTVVAVFKDDAVSGSRPPRDRAGLSALSVLRRGDTLIGPAGSSPPERGNRRGHRSRHPRQPRPLACGCSDRRRRDRRQDPDPRSDFIAEMYRDRVRQATKAALAATRARRERTSRFAPYGFRLTEDGRFEPNADEPGPAACDRGMPSRRLHWEGTA